ncbi:MAG: ThiF family adenylyltransferase, partial [bacterium]|nr:ThiF family adenylyltransferase [bacterium]
NLNRIRAKLAEVGTSKAEVAARNTWDVDPFALISLYAAGLNKDNITEFICQRPKLDLFVDEMDSIPMKIRARQICRQHKIPLAMATDNGNGIILDVERFDKEPKRPLLHGIMERMDPERIQNLDFRSWVKVANKIVGNESLGIRMRQSISEIGKTISGMPQLGASAAMAGSIIAFVARSIANKQPMPSGRYRIEFENIFLKKRQ